MWQSQQEKCMCVVPLCEGEIEGVCGCECVYVCVCVCLGVCNCDCVSRSIKGPLLTHIM